MEMGLFHNPTAILWQRTCLGLADQARRQLNTLQHSQFDDEFREKALQLELGVDELITMAAQRRNEAEE
jgi:hypothetical protein